MYFPLKTTDIGTVFALPSCESLSPSGGSPFGVIAEIYPGGYNAKSHLRERVVMKPKTVLWIVVAVVAVVAVAIGLLKPAGGGIVNVDAAGAQQAIGAGAQVIDVRTPGEYQMGHIAGALNVPVDQLEQQAQSWNRDQTYVVYCATGARSTTAIEMMRTLGFTNIKHLAAGIQSWGGELQRGEGTASKVETSGKPVLIEFFTKS